MSATRAQRRALRRQAEDVAARMAAVAYDFEGEQVERISDRHAKAALRRAFHALLLAGGEPLAIRLSEQEARGFPRYRSRELPGGVTWLAVGFDPAGHASYAMQSARANGGISEEMSSEAAKVLALCRLAEIAARPGLPIGTPKGRA
ncbi:hypothetical protein [Paroceanicella profunda]|uniref:hypothetical protein n=1 Tax=Paroceanicella profunda TaxID=2579971 RepID=UPI001478C950|nr:hypothetical protein [Paroceanicella profunda]